jgi:hypothetical protein
MMCSSARFARVLALAVALVIFRGTVKAADPGEMPWSFVNGAAEGYSVQLVSAVPAPGTQIFPGQTLEFNITIAYQLSIADTGSVVLVVQDEQNKNLLGTQPQRTQAVQRGQGNVTLTQKLVVPADTSEVRLFIPLAPKDMVHTSGELVLRYPVGHEAKSSTIGYPTVAAALADLRTKPDVEVSVQNGWTIAVDKSHFTIWSFAPQGNPAYPSVVRRAAVQTATGVNMKMDVLCEASKNACDQLMLDFQALNQRAQGSLQKH